MLLTFRVLLAGLLLAFVASSPAHAVGLNEVFDTAVVDSAILGSFNSSGTPINASASPSASNRGAGGYRYLWDNCRGYANPSACANVFVFGVIQRPDAPDSQKFMNRFVRISGSGARAATDITVTGGIVNDNDLKVGANEIGILNLSYYRGHANAPFERCDGQRVICGSEVKGCPALGVATSCTPIAVSVVTNHTSAGTSAGSSAGTSAGTTAGSGTGTSTGSSTGTSTGSSTGAVCTPACNFPASAVCFGKTVQYPDGCAGNCTVVGQKTTDECASPACEGTSPNLSECSANAPNVCPGYPVMDDCNRACPTNVVGQKTGCTTDMLSGNVHSKDECVAAGGTVVYEKFGTGTYVGVSGSGNDVAFCKFNFSSPATSNRCPAGWTQYRSYVSGVNDSSQCSASLSLQAVNYADGPGCSSPQTMPTAYGCGSDYSDAVVSVAYGQSKAYNISVCRGFQNASLSAVTVPESTQYKHVCINQGSGSLNRRLERELESLLNLLVPNAYAKAMCDSGTVISCQVTSENQTCLPNRVTSMGCY